MAEPRAIDVIAGMSHELRTPLTAIIGFAELLASGEVDLASAEAKDFLGDVLSSSRHLLHLLNNVLDLAQIEAGRLTLAPAAVALPVLVEEAIGLVRPRALARSLGIAHELDPALGRVTVDAARCKQVLWIFLSNALDFTADGGAITVRARAEGDDAFRLEVADTGIGIAEADLGRLFLTFDKLGSSPQQRRRGTALGLAIARRVVEAHGGTVGVSSQPGVGSVFHAVLPRAPRMR